MFIKLQIIQPQNLSHTLASHHQDLYFILFVRPVKEGDAGIFAQEWR